MLYFCLILVILILVALLHVPIYRHVLRPFYSFAEKPFRNPGIDTPFDEQGITYDAESGLFLFSGYMKDHSASPVFLVNPETGETVKRVSLMKTDGSIFTGHAGGIAVSDSFVYIAGSTDDCVYVYDKCSIIQAEDGADIVCIGTFPLSTSRRDGVRASFLASSDDGILYVGEFHFDWLPPLRSRRNHTFHPETGKTNALLVGFRMDDSLPLGLDPIPCVAYCIPDEVQGAALSDGKLILSKAFGLPASSILFYDLTEKKQVSTFSLLDTNIPLYGLPKASETIRAFPLTEGIVAVDGSLYISSELANMFPRKLWRLFGCDWCYSVAVPSFKQSEQF